MGNYVTVTPNSGGLEGILLIGLPVEKFGVSVRCVADGSCILVAID